MSDPNPNPNPDPKPGDGTPPAGDPTPNPNPNPDPPADPPANPKPGDDPKTFDEDYVKGLRRESAGYRTRAQTAEAKVAELEKAQTDGAKALTDENESLKSQNEQLRQRIRRSAFIETIALPNARAAWALTSDLGLDVRYDDQDRPTNLDTIRTALRKEDPALFGDGSADGGSGNGSGTGNYQGAPGLGRMRHAYANQKKE